MEMRILVFGVKIMKTHFPPLALKISVLVIFMASLLPIPQMVIRGQSVREPGDNSVPNSSPERNLGSDNLQTIHNFSFKSILASQPMSLSASIHELNRGTGYISIWGGDSRGPSTPFTFIWGDGVVEQRWFNASHTYQDRNRNYVISITAHYPNSTTATLQIPVRFADSVFTPISLPPETAVDIPTEGITLDTRLYSPPSYNYFDDSNFYFPSRATIEYVLSSAADIQIDFANQDVERIGIGFQQMLLRNPDFGGMISIWYTSPVSFMAGNNTFLGNNLPFSSFFHEMGHNVTLNSPAGYYYGGKIDGDANAIYSETLAQIFQHATAYEMINHPSDYGLSADLLVDIMNDANTTMTLVASSYNRYIRLGKDFHSWNDPATTQDETFDTFMTLAYKFFEHAEQIDDYRSPLQRMMFFLQKFNPEWRSQYSQASNSTDAETFRSTLMVSAISYAFQSDLRQEFRELNFPVDDNIYSRLNESVAPSDPHTCH
jgi:hypothetical protein